MLWIGLTGGIASGKSTVAKILSQRSIPVSHADILAREVIEPGTGGFDAVVKAFGRGVLTADGNLDRKALGQIVFANPQQREKLESIIHPLVRDRALADRAGFAQSGAKLSFYEVPLLFEKDLESSFDFVVVVSCNPEMQKQRAMARDELPVLQVEQRIAAQLPLSEKIKRADYVIHNDGTLKDLESEVDKMLLAITKPKNTQAKQ